MAETKLCSRARKRASTAIVQARVPARVLATVLALGGCTSTEEPTPYGDPTALSIQTDSLGIRASVVSPTTRVSTADAYTEVTLSAYVVDAAAPLDVWVGKLDADVNGEQREVGLQKAVATGAPGPEQRFTVSVPLLHGANRVFARIATSDRARVRTLTFVLDYNGPRPGVTLGVSASAAKDAANPCIDAVELATPITNHRNVCVHGRVSAVAGGKLSARVSLPGGASSEVPLDASGRYAVGLTLPPNQTSALQLDVADGSQQTNARYALVQDETPPLVRISSASRQTDQSALEVAGTAEDPSGITELVIESASGGRTPLDVGTTFKRSILLGVGDNQLTVVATDGAGNQAREPVNLSRLRVVRLGAPNRNAGTQDIEVNRQALVELLSADDQKQIELVSIDLLPAVRQALERIREPTRFGVDTSKWGAPERNLQRILRMTPDVADLSGTSVAELLKISSAVGLPAPRLLAQLLDLTTTQYILDLDIAASVIDADLIGTHPNIARDASGKPVLSVSMYDVLQDLTTVGPRFGPSGTHPGFLAAQSRSLVLEPGFLLTFPVHSNLAQYDAVDLSRAAKDFLFLLEGERVLDFNILTDEFAVVGLVDEPTIDLRFLLKESATLARAGQNRTAAPDAADAGFYRGNGAGFSLDRFLFEHIAAEIGYRQLHRNFEATAFKRENRYNAGSIVDAAVIGWDRGWVSITTAGGLGAPPPPLYAWDLLVEVAEARLHDEGLAQGAADMAFTLTGLPIGLTADQLVAKLRPRLNEQQDKLSELLVGSSGLASSGADVFYQPATGGDGALLFRNDSDGGGGVTYPKHGFFSDAQLTQKVSVTGPAFGVTDNSHEKVAAKVGATYYAAEQDGTVFEILVKERDPDSIGIEVRRPGAIQ